MSYGRPYDRDREPYTSSRSERTSQPSEDGRGRVGRLSENDREYVGRISEDDRSTSDERAPQQTPPPRWVRNLEIVMVLIAIAAIIVGIVNIVSCTRESETATKAETALDEAADTLDIEIAAEPAIATQTGNGVSVGDDGILIVALDPGHGGYDNGAEAYGLDEAVLNWKICNYCADYLEQVPGVEVVFTRGDGEFLDGLDERAQRAVDANADVLVSIHINENDDDDSCTGFYIYYPSEAIPYNYETSEIGRDLAEHIEARLNTLDFYDNGILSTVLYVDPYNSANERYVYPGDESGMTDYFGIIRWPRWYGMPAVLVENGFLNNPDDAARLADDAFLEELGVATAKAILETYGFVINAE